MRKYGKIAFLLIVTALLFACATAKNYDHMLNGFLGASETDVIKHFGRPSAIKIIDNNTKILAYTQVDDVFVPSEFYTYQQGEEIYGADGMFSPFLNTYLFAEAPGDIGYEADYICKTLFLLKNGHVVSWRWQGNNCVAR